MTGYVAGKLFKHRTPDGKSRVDRYLGGPENDEKSWQTLGMAERMSEWTGGDGWNVLDLPEFADTLYPDRGPDGQGENTPLPAKAQLAQVSLLLSSGDPDKMKQAVKKVDPNALFGEDYNGSIHVTYVHPTTGEKTQAYVNKPGMSAQDIGQIAAETLSIYGPAKALGVGKQGVSMLGNIGRGMLAGTFGSASRDVGANLTAGRPTLDSFIGDKSIDTERALTEGVFEAGAIGIMDVLAVVVPPLRNLLQSGRGIVDKNGNPTADMRSELKELGLDWDQMTDEWRTEIVETAFSNKAFNAREAAVLAEANTLPGPNIPMSRGAVTGDPGTQLREDEIAKGVYGQDAADRMRDFRDGTQEALNENQQALQMQIAGDSELVTRNQGASTAQENLANMRQQEKMKADRLYDEARTTGDNARLIPGEDVVDMSLPGTITPASLQTLLINVRRSLDDRFTISDLAGSPKDLLGDLESFAADPNTSLTKLFNWRQKLNQATPGTPDYRARQVLGDQYDDFIDNAFKNDLLSGDPQAVQMWKNASSNYKEFADRWMRKDMLDDLTRPRKGQGRGDDVELELEVSSADAANFIFGASNLGFMNKRNLQRDILKMKKIMPGDDFDLLRQELFMRIMDAGRSGGNQVSGAKLATSVNKVMRENTAVLNAMFTGDEVKMLNQFTRVADRATSLAKNNSNSGIVAVKSAQDMWKNVANLMRFRGPILSRTAVGWPLVGETIERRARLSVPGPDAGYSGTPPRVGPFIPTVGAQAVQGDYDRVLPSQDSQDELTELSQRQLLLMQ